MPPALAALPLACIAAVAPAAAPPKVLENPGFTEGTPGQAPMGWLNPKASREAGYTAELAEDSGLPGKRCAVLRNGKSSPGTFGNLMQTLDAAPYRGKRIRLRSQLRLDAGGTGAQGMLWFRVDRPDKRMGFFDNMSERPVTAAAWTPAEIVGDVAPDAERLALGALLEHGGGPLRIAPFTLEVLGDTPVVPVEGPRPLTEAGCRNLEAFARSFSYVRFFHPSVEAARADWDRLARAGVRAVEGAATAGDLARRLQQFFAPYAPTARFLPADRKPAPLAPPPGATQIVRWNHLGFGQQDAASIYQSHRDLLPLGGGRAAGWMDPARPSALPVGGGITLLLPTVCYADDQGATLPRAERQPAPGGLPEPTRGGGSGDDRATRLGDVVLAWGVFQHFFPYFDVTRTDWKAELPRALRSAATDRDGEAFRHTLLRMTASLKDGHVWVTDAGTWDGSRVPDLDLLMVDGNPVVRVSKGSAAFVPAGSRILTVDGEPASVRLARLRAETSAATEGWMAHRLCGALLAGGAPTVKVTYRTFQGALGEAVLPRDAHAWDLGTAGRPRELAELRPGLWYVDLDRVTEEAFAKALPDLAAAKGVVFDLRGYPKMGPGFLQHLTDGPLESAFWNLPRITRPDRKDIAWEASGRWNLEPQAPRIRGRVAFLAGGGAISYAESCLGIVEAYKLAEIVGEPTAGTNGNVNPFTLPGGYSISWTGMKVLKHDGTRHHGVGIHPTVPVLPTAEGLAAGRDEVLEKALDVISR